MSDVLYVVTTLAAFALLAALVGAVDRRLGRPDDRLDDRGGDA